MDQVAPLKKKKKKRIIESTTIKINSTSMRIVFCRFCLTVFAFTFRFRIPRLHAAAKHWLMHGLQRLSPDVFLSEQVPTK
jgi:hypothetical protein